MPRSPWRRRAPALLTAALLALPLTAPAVAADEPVMFPPVNESFVSREGARLLLDGETFRYNGANMYWLGLDENVPPGNVDYPTGFRIRDALDTAADMGLTVVRSHMFVSTGHPRTLLPVTTGPINTEALDPILYSIAYAGSLGIRLILPLTDEWDYFHGGHRDFARAYGECTTPGHDADCPQFFTDERMIGDFETYIDTVMNLENPYNGLKLNEDPTILAWQLGNELENVPQAWTDRIASFIKDRTDHQLVAAGNRFGIDPAAVASPDVDIVDQHFYSNLNAPYFAARAAEVVAAGKVYIAGEYASTAASDALLEPFVANEDMTGLNFWSLFPHDDRYGFVPHDDGFTLHNPGTSASMRDNVEALRRFSEDLGDLPANVLTRAPLLTRASTVFGFHELTWRGTAGAVGYHVEVDTGEGWQRLTDEPVGNELPYLDTETVGAATYRVLPVDRAGATGPASDPVTVGAGERLLVDPVEDLLVVSDHAGLRVRMLAESARLTPVADGAFAQWSVPGTIGATFTLTADATPDVVIEASADTVTWTEVVPAVSGADGTWVLDADVPAGTAHVRLTWGEEPAELAFVEIRSSESVLTGLEDPLDNLDVAAGHSGAIGVDAGDPIYFDGDTGRVKRYDNGAAAIWWHLEGLTGFDATGWIWPDQHQDPADVPHFTFQISEDGETWTPVEVTRTGSVPAPGGLWGRFVYSAEDLPEGTAWVRAEFGITATEDIAWANQLGHVVLRTGAAEELTAPGAFAATGPADGTTDLRGVPDFTWEPATQTAFYRFTLSENADLSDPVVFEPQLTSTSHRPEVDMAEATTYYWSVAAVNGVGVTAITDEVLSFTTATRPVDPWDVEDFESFGSDEDLTTAWDRNTGGGAVTTTLVETGTGQGMAMAYDLSGAGYAGITRTLAPTQDWWGHDGLTIWLDRTGLAAGQDVTVQFREDGWIFFETTLPDVGPQAAGDVFIPFTAFDVPSWMGGDFTPRLVSVDQISFYLGGDDAGTMIVDEIRATRAPSTPEPPVFADVPDDHPFFTEIEWLVAQGLATGSEVAGEWFFRPGDRMSRQAMAAFLYRYAGEGWEPDPGTVTFSDVPQTHPFHTEIEWLAHTGLSTGYGDGTFGPGATVSRQAMAAYLHRLAGEPVPTTDPGFTDVPAGHPFAQAIAWLQEVGITEGYPDGSFGAGAEVSRQATAAFLRRFDGI